MRIAFTHNLQTTLSEEEADFDAPQTVMAVATALRKLGHDVEPLEVSGPASRVVARLEALAPDLIFNSARGARGRFREAFYPALFDRLGMAFTGSDSYASAISLDKHLTKMIVERAGVPSPRGVMVTRIQQLGGHELRYPIIVKPNFEGSSMGITVRSVVESDAELHARVLEILGRYPAGVLVEEFVPGRDIAVPFLERAAAESGGVLEPAVYDFDPAVVGERRHQLYDFELKSLHADAVHVSAPADIPPAMRTRAMDLARVAFDRLGIRDMARADFRLGDDGRLYFLEVNPLPRLERGAALFASAAAAGLSSMEAVLGAVVESAAARQNIPVKRARRHRRHHELRVGLTFNLRRASSEDMAVDDREAEYDSPNTVAAIREAIASYGHSVVELEANADLPRVLPEAGVDVVFNIAEGIEGRTREAQVPALLELLGIAYTGSDPTALALAHDKSLAKRVVAQTGVATAPFFVMTSGRQRLDPSVRFPLVVKPLAEGSSKGVTEASVVGQESELRAAASDLIARYGQPVLVEQFLPGREFTVAMLGERRPRVLAPLEVVFRPTAGKFPLYSYSIKFIETEKADLQVPAKIDAALQKGLERAARSVFRALGCRDLARVDFRLDESGRINFVECNPLPGLTPKFSDMCNIAEASGLDYRTLIGEILAPAIRRMRDRDKQRLLASRLS